MTATVRENPDKNRYEVYDDDRLAGFVAYKLTGHRLALTHTEIEEEFGGRGLAKLLVTEALDDARRRGLHVLPFCPYVRKVIADDPATYLALVPERDRSRFDLEKLTA